jgi:hypothetical protein
VVAPPGLGGRQRTSSWSGAVDREAPPQLVLRWRCRRWCWWQLLLSWYFDGGVNDGVGGVDERSVKGTVEVLVRRGGDGGVTKLEWRCSREDGVALPNSRS